MSQPFRVTLKGCFYSLELYDQQGRSVYTLDEAVEAANAEYGTDWREVYNGEDAANSDTEGNTTPSMT